MTHSSLICCSLWFKVYYFHQFPLIVCSNNEKYNNSFYNILIVNNRTICRISKLSTSRHIQYTAMSLVLGLVRTLAGNLKAKHTLVCLRTSRTRPVLWWVITCFFWPITLYSVASKRKFPRHTHPQFCFHLLDLQVNF